MNGRWRSPLFQTAPAGHIQHLNPDTQASLVDCSLLTGSNCMGNAAHSFGLCQCLCPRFAFRACRDQRWGRYVGATANRGHNTLSKRPHGQSGPETPAFVSLGRGEESVQEIVFAESEPPSPSSPLKSASFEVYTKLSTTGTFEWRKPDGGLGSAAFCDANELGGG